MATYSFEIRGEFMEVDSKLVEIVDHGGLVTGFLLPDGRSVQLVMALEVMSADGEKFEYVTTESKMDELGLAGLDYISLTFNKEKE